MSETVSNPLAEFRATNVSWTLNLARSAAAAGVRRFVFVSSVKVNGESTCSGEPFAAADLPNPLDPYGISKHEAEQGLLELAALTGMEVVIVRPPLVYGPGVRANFRALLQLAGRKVPLPLGGIDNLRSFVGIDNLVDLLAVCTVHPKAGNQVFMVSDGEDISTSELIERMACAMGKRAWLLPCPARLIRWIALGVGRPGVADRLLGSLQVDIQPTMAQLNWTPSVSLDEELKRTVSAGEVVDREKQNLGGRSGNVVKRCADLVLGALCLAILALPLLLIATAVKTTSPGTALYWSDRVGRNNRIFRMPKFRSMRVDTPAVATHLLENPDKWLTPIGSFLRRSSLDELPQIWSILKGDMSFVGPRPALFNQHDLVELRTKAGVHRLMPGLTGWAQINGRDELPIPQKVQLDTEYLHRQSFFFDLKILALTAWRVVKRQGVTH